MARPLRIEYPGALYHLTARGNRREDIFLDDGDRLRFLEILGEACDRFDWAIHAWCLMGNHYHLVAETAHANLSRGMRQLNGVYTQAFNRRHGSAGHLFQGRYKAILVQKESHLLELARYVVLNPVRAGMVSRVEGWRWSSHRAVIGQAPAPAWLDAGGLLAHFGARRDPARRRYEEFVAEGLAGEGPWRDLRHQIYLGDEAFIARVAQGLAPDDLSADVPKAQRQSLAKPLADYRRAAGERDDAMAEAYRCGAYSMKEIAACFGVHPMTVSRAVRKREAAHKMFDC